VSDTPDWASWLDKFERDVWPIFERRGYSRDTAALIYFTKYPDTAETIDDDEEETA
jgi:hypothetical protein